MPGVPGDYTPPSRFFRAMAFKETARKTNGAFNTTRELFRILDSFNLSLEEQWQSQVTCRHPARQPLLEDVTIGKHSVPGRPDVLNPFATQDCLLLFF